MFRVQVYNWDMGLFRKQYIIFAEAERLAEKLNEFNFAKYRRAFVLPEDDPYGHTLPECFDGYLCE